MRTKEEVVKAFTPISNTEFTNVKRQKVTLLQQACIDFAATLIDLVPDSADRTASMRKLMEIKMTCTQAITHYIDPIMPKGPNAEKVIEKKVSKKDSEAASARSTSPQQGFEI